MPSGPSGFIPGAGTRIIQWQARALWYKERTSFAIRFSDTPEH